MNVKISLLCLSVCFAAAISMSISDEIDREWVLFKKNYEKNYHAAEEPKRKQNFKENFEKIKHHNDHYANKKFTYKLGINKFADWNETEIKDKLKTTTILTKNFPSKYEPTPYKIPEYVDWRQNFTSEVKDEGGCQSDWAFASAGILEGYVFKKTGKFTPVSVQDIIDCSSKNGNHGCGPGYIGKSIYYVEDNGIATEKSYPFKANKQGCREDVKRDGIPDHNNIECKKVVLTLDEGVMKKTLHQEGPIAAKIFAPWKFFFYKEGIFTGEDCEGTKEIDYSVLIVGYYEPKETNESKEPKKSAEKYWIVKNWFGKDWGEQGYVRIEMKKNTCQIASKPRIISDKNDDNFLNSCEPEEDV